MRREKLTIQAFNNDKRSGVPLEVFVAMFNPASYSRSFGVEWSRSQSTGAGGQSVKFLKVKEPDLTLDLLIDGTEMFRNFGSLLGSSKKEPLETPKIVRKQVELFKKTAYRLNGEIHQPNYLLVSWGALVFSCRLASVDITYDLFDRHGEPLRARLATKFTSDKADLKQALQDNKNSPDLTHERLVSQSDSLSALTREIYGSSSYLFDVARWNGIDQPLGDLSGRRVVFPPLKQLVVARGA